MPRPRGPTGSVRGVPATIAQEYLEKLVKQLAEESDRGDGRFRRSRATEILRGWFKEESVVDGLLLALERIPGIQNLGDGILWLPAEPLLHVKMRSWRMSLGRINFADAEVLLCALQAYPLTDNLEKLEARLARALRPAPEGAAK